MTLTLDPKRPGPTGRAVSTSRDAIEREAKWWVGLVGRLSRSTVVWVMAPERQQSGNWHAHLVLDVVTDDAVRAATNDWEVRNGWCRVRRVDDPQGAVGYVVKGAVWVWTSDTLGPHVDKLRRDGGMRGRHP